MCDFVRCSLVFVPATARTSPLRSRGGEPAIGSTGLRGVARALTARGIKPACGHPPAVQVPIKLNGPRQADAHKT
jgi:hypothetical protein